MTGTITQAARLKTATAAHDVARELRYVLTDELGWDKQAAKSAVLVSTDADFIQAHDDAKPESCAIMLLDPRITVSDDLSVLVDGEDAMMDVRPGTTYAIARRASETRVYFDARP